MAIATTFLGVETALRGILAQQQALDTTGNNIANANTPGYTRQIAVMTPTGQYPTPSVDAQVGPQIGTGVTVSEYQRVRDDFLDVQVRAQMMNSGYYDAVNTGLDQVQASLAEPSSNGLSTLLSNFWGSWQDLGNNPESTAARQAVLQSGQAVADGFNQLSSQLQTFSSQNDQNVQLTLKDLNSTTSQIATLNQQIQQAEQTGLTPNDLLDQRDNLIDHLTTLANVTVVPSTVSGATGEVDIWVGPQTTGTQLVSAASATTIDPSGTATASTLSTLLPDLNLGKLGGIEDLGSKISSYRTTLDGLASSLHDQVNTLEPGYFAGAAGTATAATLSVAMTSPSSLVTGAAGNPGDGSTATAVADLQTASGSPATAGSPTIDANYQAFVTTVGSDAQQASSSATTADALTQSLQNRRQSVIGVSLDEEMTNLLKYQRGYQASARALSAMDDMLSTLITRTGRVGL